jgi:co-chaperonin GroES (HSP10)
MRLLPKKDYVILRARPGLLEETTSSGLVFTHGALDASQAAIAAAVNTVGFVPLHHLQAVSGGHSGDPEAMSFAEVVAVGPGHPGMPEDRPGLQRGDLVGYLRNRVAGELDDFETGKREPLLQLHEHGIPVRYRRGAGQLPEPLSNWVLTCPDPIAAARALGRTLPLTEEEVSQGVVVRVRDTPKPHGGAGRGHQQQSRVATRADRVVIERVVATGPGRWVRAVFSDRREFPEAKELWVPNDTGQGELLMLLGCGGRARFRLHGQSYSLVPWSECSCAIDESVLVSAWAS